MIITKIPSGPSRETEPARCGIIYEIAPVRGTMDEKWREYHSRWEGRHWLDRAMQHWEFNIKFHRKISAHLRPGDSLLDIGSGKGYSAFYFAACGHPVTGIDPDAPSIEEANEWADRLALPARFIVGDIFDVSLSERFRLSYSMGLIEHYSPQEAVRLLAIQSEVSDLVAALAPTRHSARTVESCPVPWTPQTVESLRRTFEAAGLTTIDAFGSGEVSAKWDSRFKSSLPQALLHFLQNRISYAMGVGIVGVKPVTLPRGGDPPRASA
jgi:SAM-dependent methyltransferase